MSSGKFFFTGRAAIPRAVAMSLALGVGLAACEQPATVSESTAERVKRVEARQKNDPNFHLEQKAANAPALATPAAASPPAATEIRVASQAAAGATGKP